MKIYCEEEKNITFKCTLKKNNKQIKTIALIKYNTRTTNMKYYEKT